MKIDTTTQLMTTEEVATFFNVSEETVKRWGRAGKLRVIRINKRGDRRYHPNDVQKFMEEAHNDREPRERNNGDRRTEVQPPNSGVPNKP